VTKQNLEEIQRKEYELQISDAAGGWRRQYCTIDRAGSRQVICCSQTQHLERTGIR